MDDVKVEFGLLNGFLPPQGADADTLCMTDLSVPRCIFLYPSDLHRSVWLASGIWLILILSHDIYPTKPPSETP